MAPVQCNACGGVYDTVSADGVRYFHACPPISGVTVWRNGQGVVIPLVELRGDDLVQVRRGGKVLNVGAGAMLPDDLRLGDVDLPRPDARDENIDLVKVKAVLDDDGKRRSGTRDEDVIKRAGAGVTKL